MKFWQVVGGAVVQVLPVMAQCDCNPAALQYAVYPDEVRRQTYLTYTNAFDEVGVVYRIGEFQLVSEEGVRVVGLQWKAGQYVAGQDAQGEDQRLLEYGRTESFVVPANGSMRFFRLLELAVHCGSRDTVWRSEKRSRGFPEREWVVPFMAVPDRMEFVLQLVRASDGVVLAVLDSVGVLPTTEQQPREAPFYGTEPMEAVHERDLPPEWAGTEVYLRVSPRRWRPTPYGMGVKISADKVAWSSIYGYSPQREGADQCWRWCVEAYGGGRAWLDTVEAYYFWNYFVPYTDSIKAATGCILFNYPPHLNGIPVAYRRDLWRAWEERNGIITVWRDSSARGRAGEIIEVGCEAETPVVAAVGTRQTGRKALAQLQIIPQPAPAGGELTLQWKQGQTTVVEEVRLYDGVGRLLGSLWQGVWQPPLPLVLKLPAEVSAGQYWLVLRTQRGWEIAPLQIVKSSP